MASDFQDDDDGSSIMRQIDRIEVELKSLYHRLETLENNLQYRPLTMEEREAMEQDVQQLRDVLKVQEEHLKKLRKDNRATVLFVIVLLIGTGLFYVLYSLLFRNLKL